LPRHLWNYSVTERDERPAYQHGHRKAKQPRLNRKQNAQGVRPNTNECGPREAHPHETSSRHNHTCQPRRPSNRQQRTTSDHLGRGTREAAQRGPARHPNQDIQDGPARTRLTTAHGDAELPQRSRGEGVPREARAPGLHRVVSQGTKQRQRRGPRGARTTPSTGAQRGGRKTRAGRPAPSQHPCAPQPSWEAARLLRRRTRRLNEWRRRQYRQAAREKQT
jgi:hypothetical protein